MSAKEVSRGIKLNWIDQWVGIGNLIDANLVDELRDQDVDFIMDVRTLFDATSPGLLHHHHPVMRKILKAASLLVTLSELDAKVMIHCLEGIDRTPFVAMVYVSQKYGMSYEDAYKRVAEKRTMRVFIGNGLLLESARAPPPMSMLRMGHLQMGLSNFHS
jgi:protein-tyrosine phosphatase